MITDMVEGNDINFQISNIKKRIKVVEDYLKDNPNDWVIWKVDLKNCYYKKNWECKLSNSFFL